MKERWMGKALDQWLIEWTVGDEGGIEGAMDDTSVGSVSKWRSAGWHKRCINEQVKKRWMAQALDQWASEGTMGGTSHGLEQAMYISVCVWICIYLCVS